MESSSLLYACIYLLHWVHSNLYSTRDTLHIAVSWLISDLDWMEWIRNWLLSFVAYHDMVIRKYIKEYDGGSGFIAIILITLSAESWWSAHGFLCVWVCEGVCVMWLNSYCWSYLYTHPIFNMWVKVRSEFQRFDRATLCDTNLWQMLPKNAVCDLTHGLNTSIVQCRPMKLLKLWTLL